MAIVKIDPTSGVQNDAAAITFTAIDAADGIYIKYADAVDERIAVLLQNTAAAEATVTAKKGDGIQGVVDSAMTVPASGFSAVNLESGAFEITSGTYKGYVHLTGPATVKVAAVRMP